MYNNKKKNLMIVSFILSFVSLMSWSCSGHSESYQIYEYEDTATVNDNELDYSDSTVYDTLQTPVSQTPTENITVSNPSTENTAIENKKMPAVEVNPYYEEGYERGLEDGADDGFQNLRGYSFDDDCPYRGHARKEYEEGYEDGYDEGYDDGFEESKIDPGLEE